MFYYVEGTVSYLEPNLAVIDCGGVGYACATTAATQSRLSVGKSARLFTYLHVREEIFDLYGFSSQKELAWFKRLISVSGVGPKAALSILSANSPEGLSMAILAGDEKALMVAQGIGKKIAQRILLELKDKLAADPSAFSGGSTAANAPFAGGGGKTAEAAAALSVLGYSAQEIAVAMQELDTAQLSLEEIVRQSLRRMAKG